MHACVTVGSNDANELALACALGFETLHLSNLWRKICYFFFFDVHIIQTSMLYSIDHVVRQVFCAAFTSVFSGEPRTEVNVDI